MLVKFSGLNLEVSCRSCVTTAKKCTKKFYARAKLLLFFAHLNVFFCWSSSPLQKLPIVVIQKFFYHGNVTSHFSSLLTCNLFTHGLNVSVCSRSNWNLRRGGKPMMNLEKNFQSKGESKQQTQPTSWRRRQDTWLLSPLRHPCSPSKALKLLTV